MDAKWRGLVVLPVLLVAGVEALRAGLIPELVSPGDLRGVVEIADHCPTFNWGAVEGAKALELVVYRLPTQEALAAPIGEGVTPILQQTLPGGATGWTPSVDRCLEPGQGYAWTLRAVGDGKAPVWADPRLFTVRALPSMAEIEAALAVLTRYGQEELPAEELAIEVEAVAANERLEPEDREPGVIAELAAVEASAPEGSGIAAIRGEVSDPTGETYGVEGISNSLDGAGLSAENTADATDLLLRGDGVSPDAQLTESVLDRVSDSDQAFDIRNSGTGSMTLQVDGTDVVTAATDSDTLGELACNPPEIAKWNGASWQCAVDENDDTLGQLSCADNQVPQWDGAAWVCANTGTDTLASLSCGSGQVVHWNGSVWVCGQPDLTYVSCSSSTSCSVNCPAGTIVWVGGCGATPTGSATLVYSRPTSAGGGMPPTGWECRGFNPLGPVTVAADLYCVGQ